MKRRLSLSRFSFYFSFFIFYFSLLFAIPCFSQTDDTHQIEQQLSKPVQFSLGADLASRYIWRGRDYGNSPCIQPNVAVSFAGLKFGVWGSYGFVSHENSGSYAEIDPYISYTWKWFTIGVTDYFFPNGFTPNDGNTYFNYESKTTGHTFEGCLTFTGPEKFPITVFAGTHFYGADKGTHPKGVFEPDTSNVSNFSTYFEVSYPFTVKGIGVKPFVGGIPFGSGWYGLYGGIVNAGVTVSKSIKITDKFELPVFGSVIGNPQAENLFLVFGISL
jgi:hypothetical protein